MLSEMKKITMLVKQLRNEIPVDSRNRRMIIEWVVCNVLNTTAIKIAEEIFEHLRGDTKLDDIAFDDKIQRFLKSKRL